MSTLYIAEDYAVIRKQSQRLVVEKDNKVLLEMPAFKVDRILLFGKIQVTADAVEHLLDSHVDVAFFNCHGRLKGKLTDYAGKNVHLRMAQYACYHDSAIRLGIARSIVAGKIRASIALLQRFSRNHPEAPFQQPLQRLAGTLTLLERKTTIGGLMGMEGVAAGIYFPCLAHMLSCPEWRATFNSRTRRPPRDPVNAMLSLGYAMLTNELWALLDGIGYDPFVGFLHEIDYGRPSLALDLAEEFRVPVVDRAVLEMVNHRIITPADFEDDPDIGCRITQNALKKYFAHFDRRLRSELRHPDTGETTTYRKMFLYQAQKMAEVVKRRCLDGPYRPFQAP